MISYTKRYVNTISLIVTIPVFFILSFKIPLKNNFKLQPISYLFKKSSVLVELNTNNINQETEEIVLNNQNNHEISKKIDWKIIIPKISLEAEISEGTGKEIMDKYVGHFDETALKDGNIGLAAHNRGYAVNYFENIKKLQEGDEVIYKYYDFEMQYIVIENKIIKDTDWSYLEKTEDNRITLITCVENEPEYRRCIQCIQKEAFEK